MSQREPPGLANCPATLLMGGVRSNQRDARRSSPAHPFRQIEHLYPWLGNPCCLVRHGAA